ncbi:MAG: T9SS type A sorting domain-containing protein [Cyclobacteriaceae bacterium]
MKAFPLFVSLWLLLSHIATAQLVDPNFNPKISGAPTVYTHEVQTDGKILLSGDFVRFGEKSVGSVIRVHKDGTLDESFSITDAIGNKVIDHIEEMSNHYILISSHQNGGSWIITKEGSLYTNIDLAVKEESRNTWTASSYKLDSQNILIHKVARQRVLTKVDVKGEIDTSFQEIILENHEKLNDLAIQDDGKILIVGYMVGDDINPQVGFCYRLNKDGSVDNTFTNGKTNYRDIHNVEIDSDGRIYLVGLFTEYNNQQAPHGIVRLVSKGNIDPTFALSNNPNFPKLNVNNILELDETSLVITGASPIAQAQIVINVDLSGKVVDNYPKVALTKFYGYRPKLSLYEGSIIVSGYFHKANHQEYNGIIKINSIGIVQSDFDLPLISAPQIGSCYTQKDKKILIAGYNLASIEKYDGYKKRTVIRINDKGEIDPNFNTPFGHNDFPGDILQLDNGQYLISGSFVSLSRHDLIKMNNDGSLDYTFNANFNSETTAFMQVSGNEVIVGGAFDSFGNKRIHGLAKIDLDGNLIDSFNSSNLIPDNYSTLAIDTLQDGSLVIAGTISVNQVKSFVWKLAPDASEILFSLDNLPYSFVSGIEILDEKIILVGGIGGNNLPLLYIDHNGKILDELIHISESDYFNPFTTDIHKISNTELLVGGKFEEINELTRTNLAKISINGEVSESFIANTVGRKSSVSEINMINSDSVLIVGHFSGINDIKTSSIAKLRITNVTPPKITSQMKIPSFKEDSIFNIDLNTLEINQEYTMEYSKAKIYDGNNYNTTDNMITPAKDFNGNLELTISVLNGAVESDKFKYSVNITPVNDAPQITEQVQIPTFFKELAFHIDATYFNILDPDNSEFEIDLLQGENYIVSTDGIIVPESFTAISININVAANDGELQSQPFVMTVNLNEPILSISDTPADDIDIYPIPSKDLINLKSNIPLTPFQASITNLSGMRVYKGTIDLSKDSQLNIEQLKMGIYILTLTNSNHIFSKRIIKN